MVLKTNEAKYLRCMLSDKGDPDRELSKRISATLPTCKKLEISWKSKDCPVDWKLLVYDAVVKAKLLYGLESVQVNDANKKLDGFQRRA